MIVHDEPRWAAQQSEVRGRHGELGDAFLAFLEFWVEAAERIMTERPELSPADALRSAFPLAEEQYGSLAVPFLGQMLVVIVSHWEYGEDLGLGLTSLELKLLAEAVKDSIAESQAAATAASESGD